jgi:TPR repeat protein
LCYAKGDGVIQNNVKAYAWVALASANGNEDAKKGMDILKKEMTPNQIVEAQNLAEKYYNGKFD